MIGKIQLLCLTTSSIIMLTDIKTLGQVNDTFERRRKTKIQFGTTHVENEEEQVGKNTLLISKRNLL